MWINNNRIIAEFIGRCGKHKASLYTFSGVDKLLEDDIWFTIEESKFHKSWDWLMPVIEYIENLDDYAYNVSIVCNIVSIDKSDRTEEISMCHVGSKLECAYVTVIEFIEWYNNNKKHK